MMDNAKEFCAYLKNGNFKEFMCAWKNQVERYGQVMGSITITLDDKNREDIANLMGKDYYQKKYVNITWNAFQKALRGTLFEDVDFDQVVTLYFGNTIVSRKEKKRTNEHKLQSMLDEIYQAYESSIAAKWLQQVRDDNASVMSRIRQEANTNPQYLKKQLKWVMIAINEFPCWKEKQENISIFSSRITSDPHALDHGSLVNYFMIQAICFYNEIKIKNSSTIKKNEILFLAGLYKDSVSNFCALSHINAFINEDHLHPGWNGFYQHYEAWNVHMDNLNAIHKIDDSSCRIVFVVENPSVFQYLSSIAKNSKRSDIGFICTYGQLNACAYTLLDNVFQANIMMYYSGDMDPEGLLIADKLKQRYQKGLRLWRYALSDYQIAISKKTASITRLKMLELILDDTLRDIAQQLKKGYLGYQENLLNEYEKDILQLSL